MEKEELIQLCEEMGVPYIAETNSLGEEIVYVYDAGIYELKHKNPRKYNDVFLPYLRVSNFGPEPYTRHNGWCQYANRQYIVDILKELAE